MGHIQKSLRFRCGEEAGHSSDGIKSDTLRFYHSDVTFALWEGGREWNLAVTPNAHH